MGQSTARRPLRRLNTRARLLASAIVGCYAVAPVWAQLPTNPVVKSGTASFSQTGNALTVTNSNGAIIHWDSFSIGKGNSTYFAQPSASSAVLNRVVGADPSLIYGTLSSNGRVWLINPNGITVGPGGMVNTAQFVASTLNVSNANFLAGKLTFDKTPGAADVVNQGSITTSSGGSVYLVGTNVSNEGVITTPQGETLLAAGETVNLIDTGTPGVKVEITGAAGNTTNLGEIVADAGRIGMAGVIVRNSGALNASSVVNEGGRIFLKASQDTYVDGSGRIVATGTKGGRVEVLGDRVAVMDNAGIDVSGTNGGGTVLVGGDYQGKNPDIRNARISYFGANAAIKADATGNGNGGKVIVWADDTTRAYGSISARGGANAGNGGFVETSGHRYLDVTRTPDLAARSGKGGTWLLDPTDITISSLASSNITGASPFAATPATSAASNLYYGAIVDALAAGSSVIVNTTSTGGGYGDILVDSSANLSNINVGGPAGATLTLLADRHIVINHDITSTGYWLNMQFTADQQHTGSGSISIGNNVQLVTNNGDIAMSAGSGINIGSGAKLSTGNIFGSADYFHNISLTGNAAGNGYGGNVTLASGSELSASNNIDISGDSIGIGSSVGGATIKRVLPASGSANTSPANVNLLATNGDITLWPTTLIGESGGRYGLNVNLAATGSVLIRNGAPYGLPYGGAILTTGNITLVGGWDGVRNWVNNAGYQPNISGSGPGSVYIYGSTVAGGDLAILSGGDIQLWSDTSGATPYTIAHAKSGATSCPPEGSDLCFTSSYSSSIGALGKLTMLARNDISIRSDVGVGGDAMLVAGWSNYGGFILGSTLPTAVAYNGSAMNPQVEFEGGTLFSPGSGNVTITASGQVLIDSAYRQAGIDMDGGALTVSANSLTLTADVIDSSNPVGNEARIIGNGDQYFYLGDASNAGNLTLLGRNNSGSYGGSASIERFQHYGGGATSYSTGGQHFTIYYGGSITLNAGSGDGLVPANQWSGDCSGGACSANWVGIEDHGSGSSGGVAYGGAQTFDFVDGGSLALYGGSAGTYNSANISSDGMQRISSSNGQPIDIGIYGGTGGTTSGIYTLDNSAGIHSGFWQDINAYGGMLTMEGGGDTETFGGAFLSAPTQRLAFGDVFLTGGNSDTADDKGFGAPVIIGNENGADIQLSTGSLSIDGGNGIASPVGIGSLNGNATVQITASGNVLIRGKTGGVGIGSLLGGNLGDLSGNVYVANGASITAVTDGSSNVAVESDNGINVDGAIASQGSYQYFSGYSYDELYSDGVIIRSGMVYGGSIMLGPNSRISGDQVHLSANSVEAAGNIVQDAAGIITISGAGSVDYGQASSWIGAYGTAALDGKIRLGNASGGAVEVVAWGLCGYSDCGAPTIRVADITAGDGSGVLYNGDIFVDSYGDASIGRIATGGRATVRASYAIHDANGVGVPNVTANTLSIDSRYGPPDASGVAIDLDTVTVGTDPTITAWVAADYIADYGGMAIRNTGVDPVAFDIQDWSSAGSIGFSHSGNISLTSADRFVARSGDLYINADGSLSVDGASLRSSGYMALIAARNVSLSGTTAITGAGVGIQSGGTLTVAAPIDSSNGVFLNGDSVTVNAAVHDTAAAGADAGIDVMAGDFLMESGGSFVSDNGGIGILASRNASIGGVLEAGDSILIAAAGNVSFGGSASAANGAALAAGNQLSMDYGYLTADTGGIALAGATIDISNTAIYEGAATAADGGISIIAGSFTAAGQCTSLRSANGDILGIMAGNMTLSDGAFMEAGRDIKLGFAAADSTLALNSSADGAFKSYLLADSPSTISLSFLARSSGGVIIDGVATTSSVANGSGMFVVGHATPAAEGAGLSVAYAVPATTEAPAPAAATLSDVVTAINNTTGKTPAAESSQPVIPPTAPATGGAATSAGGSVGGNANEFGGSDTSAGSGDKSDSGDKDKDKKSGESSAGGKDDKKSSGNKAVGKCS